MYTREESSAIKQSFWTRFGQYMQPVPSAGGDKVSWSNYKTGIRNIYFRLKAERSFAAVAIEITHSDPELRAQYFARFEQVRSMLHETLGEAWNWEENAINSDGTPISSISVQIKDVDVLKQADWPEIISFFKPRIILLDQFWNEVKELFL
ncbi:DUF4268 domain-containing protein [Sediminibacterium ginsengisoli]|uniref:DUF4268 domain-containing protein n=1 Tax=Sediminibacterium ginsengisoli TaxID=413434 RepID=A0A1T4K8H2_9BACT|nr:DUF4268 domain-containing protein [Sediminibacterium ginsengisoli]SJZ38732.1 protein of unknown function [Sediminibacterium ginsengisoli]